MADQKLGIIKASTKVAKAPQAAPKAVAAPAETKAPAVQAKAEKTILPSGLSYSLVSRLLNSLKPEVRKTVEVGPTVTLVDGRGTSHDVHQLAIDLAANLGAKVLSENKSAYFRPRIVVDVAAKTVRLDESLVKVPFIKQKAAPVEEAKKVAE